MAEKLFSAEPALRDLKDFQRRTVDYVFERFYGQDHTTRFLVADEVGLGKTLVARGVIAKTLEYLQHTKDRIDIIYVCSNAAIANQNIGRLNIEGMNGFELATRLTYLPIDVKDLSKSRVNFISLTPGTAFDHTRSRGGHAKERTILYRILYDLPWAHGRRKLELRTGLRNMLQCTSGEDNWRSQADAIWEEDVDESLAKSFRKKVRGDMPFYNELKSCCLQFKRHRDSGNIPWEQSNNRYKIISKLRSMLAENCLAALDPDLVIMDEFQRFRDLLDGDDDASMLAKALFNRKGVRVLLLSATPYKMLSLNHDDEEDHYVDFIRTLKFLINDETEVAKVVNDIRNFRHDLYRINDGGETSVSKHGDALRSRIIRVMCRTERVGMTKNLDAMVDEPQKHAILQPNDLYQAIISEKTAKAVGARDTIEYWKSAPYLLSFLKHYDLRHKLDKITDSPPDELLSALKKAKGHLLSFKAMNDYKEISAANPRMRALIEDTIQKDMWKLLWLPPSLPYSEPGGHYVDLDPLTKSLVFSAWSAVPDAIATICSYEAERLMVAGSDKEIERNNLYEKCKPLLRFAKGKDDRLTGMPVISWLMPSPTLAETIDPLEAALRLGDGKPISQDVLLEDTKQRCEELLALLPEGAEGNRPDERWYWAAPAMLESRSRLKEWCLSEDGWVSANTDHDPGTRFRDHLNLFIDSMGVASLDLGPRPDDLSIILAELALAGPGTCALRSLKRIAPDVEIDASQVLSAAARIASGFRALFNQPETIALLRGGFEETYWRLTLRYCLDGNIQALLDEQMHVLLESKGLMGHSPTEIVKEISENLSNSLSIFAAQIKVDEIQVNRSSIKQRSANARCRFALRFGDITGDREGTLARAETVREAFNSPFRPFILATTSIGQEGLDFHTWCHAVMHWNLPSNPVDLEQREGRVHRYKGHAVRKNIAEYYGLKALRNWHKGGDPWAFLFHKAVEDREAGTSDIVPYWVFEGGSSRIERRVPLIPLSKEVYHLEKLKRGLALYRLVFGQPRQQDLLAYLMETMNEEEAREVTSKWSISLEPLS